MHLIWRAIFSQNLPLDPHPMLQINEPGLMKFSRRLPSHRFGANLNP